MLRSVDPVRKSPQGSIFLSKWSSARLSDMERILCFHSPPLFENIVINGAEYRILKTCSQQVSPFHLICNFLLVLLCVRRAQAMAMAMCDVGEACSLNQVLSVVTVEF